MLALVTSAPEWTWIALWSLALPLWLAGRILLDEGARGAELEAAWVAARIASRPVSRRGALTLVVPAAAGIVIGDAIGGWPGVTIAMLALAGVLAALRRRDVRARRRMITDFRRAVPVMTPEQCAAELRCFELRYGERTGDVSELVRRYRALA